MKEKYQLDNPNNCRIFIDYRKDKKKVRFDYVANDSIFQIAQSSYIGLLFRLPLLVLFFGMVLIMIRINNICFSIFVSLFYLTFYLIIPLLTMRSRKLQRLLPRINAFRYCKYLAEFKPINVKDNRVEIPLFRNVMLDYKATEEMGRYLERVEIVEHEFNYIIKKSKKKNQYLWKATFYFSKRPKTGELRVLFY